MLIVRAGRRLVEEGPEAQRDRDIVQARRDEMLRPPLWDLHYLGVDVGWVFPAADSDGNVYVWTQRLKGTVQLARAGPVTVRKADGRTFEVPAYTRADAVQARARTQPECYRGVAHQVVSRAKRTGRTLVLEDWTGFQKRKTAWVEMWKMIAWVAHERGVKVTQVDRAYTSITCPKCGHKDRGNRATRDRFCCMVCSFEGHADVVAAMNIAAKAAGRFRIAERPCLNPVCADGVAWSANLCVWCYNFQRQHGRLPAEEDVESRRSAPSVKRYRATRQLEVHREARERREAEAKARLMESYRTHDAWGDPLR